MIESLPPGAPSKIWLVLQPSGERHFLHKEPLEGIAAWAKGVNATVTEYEFAGVVHTPPPKRKATAK